MEVLRAGAAAGGDRARRKPERGLAGRSEKRRLCAVLLVWLCSAAAAQQPDTGPGPGPGPGPGLPEGWSWRHLASSLRNCAAARPQDSAFMRLMATVLNSAQDLQDPLADLAKRSAEALGDADFVVVGGGTAGSVVASRLSERPDWQVVLLEAGGPEPPFSQVPSFYISDADVRRALDWDFQLEPMDGACLGGACRWPRGKVMGGTSVINGMMYMRGHPSDYDKWAAAGNTGWAWKDVLPYFLKSEDNREIGENHVEEAYHSAGGFLSVQRFPDQPDLAWDILRAGEELGYRSNVDLCGHNQTGFTVAQVNVRDGQRLSLARAFLHPARHRANLRVITNAHVVRVSMDRATRRARGVIFHRDGALHKIRARKEVILCAGAVQTPHLLLLSGIGDQEHLKQVGIPVVADVPGVGKNLQNHISFSVDFAVTATSPGTNRLDVAALQNFLFNRTGPMTSTGLSQVTAFVHSRLSTGRSIDLPDLQIFFEGAIANCSITGLPGEPSHGGGPTPFRMIPVVLRPRSRGEITLGSKDPTQPPKIYANYLRDRYDVELLIDGVRLVRALAGTGPLRRRGVELVHPTAPGEGDCGGTAFDSDEYWECIIRHRTNPENHQCGTAKMGPRTDPLAVVDSRLRVRGVTALRVLDASAIPDVVSGNLNAAVIMLAERGADLVKEDYAAMV